LRSRGHPALALKHGRDSAVALRRWLWRATEPYVLFPLIAILVLALIWGMTLNLIRVERVDAERSAAISSRELADTYEAQVVRALREIDQTLKFVKYAYEREGRPTLLKELKARTLLPPDLLFVVSIADSAGDVVASSQPSAMNSVAGEDFFTAQRQEDALVVGRPRRTSDSGEWKIQFSRRLSAGDGSFIGIVMISVESSYFVSGYESSELGEHGVLAILGTDGVFRAQRSGATVTAGVAVDYAAVMRATGAEQGAVVPSINAWDGVRRYTFARQLYDFPLAVIVGLSSDEQGAAARGDMRAYIWRAIAGSVLLVLIIAMLARMGRQLALSRLRAVEEHIAHAARVEFIAYHDGLTTLPNRSLFSKLLDQSIRQAHRHKRQLAVVFLDLDRFKHVNDTLGHQAGDQLLQEFATRLKACLRDSDTVARLGGDEFVALLPEIDEERYVAAVAQKILTATAAPFVLLGQECRVTASIGISIYPQDGLDEQTLEKNADIAMYRAKEEGKNNFQFYSEKLNTNSLERLTLESGLRHALERSEFQLDYRTKRDSRGGRITGLEARLRWRRSDRDEVAPAQYIAIAEETGLILPIGKWMVRTACLQNVAWQGQGLPCLSMAVKLTASQFYDENLVPDLAAILAETGMDALLLELDIHESVLMSQVDKTLRILTGLNGIGIRIAIDDFGSGYSTLSTLERFPPLDTIRIARSLIRDVTRVDEYKGLTDAIIAMARALSSTVVAQGVETEEKGDRLRLNAGDEIQAFYLGMAVPAIQVALLLRSEMDTAVATTGAPG
jgi:diguanylate cyclase (GGDEF)-like protein